MKIHNFRAGFATNSSSSHSVILLPDNLVGKVAPIDEDVGNDDYFGWDHFRLVSEEAKLRYLAAQFFSRFSKSGEGHEDEVELRQRVVARIDQEMPGIMEGVDVVGEQRTNTYGGKEYTSYDYTMPSVDHQSVFGLSKKDDNLEDLIRLFKSPKVVILGGNDNSDEHPNEVDGAEKFGIFQKIMTDGADGVSTRRDGPYWIAFDHRDGTKARMSFDAGVPDYTKSSTPELVDLKITDYCGKGCNFCYQSSTTDGVHADFDEIVRVLDMFAEMQVFEVAIGGGEPTDHPRFADILKAAAERGVKPNFTTFTDKWLGDEGIVAAVAENVGGIGVSCTDKKGLRLVEKIKKAMLDASGWSNVKVSAQHVFGSVPVAVTGELLSEAFEHFHDVLLLGFKEVGFGSDYFRYDGEHAEVALTLAIKKEKKRWIKLSVDTALVDQYPDFLKALDVPDALITSPEGKFSCYVDAVTGKVGPSSYVRPETMTKVPSNTDEFRSVFATY